MQIKLIRMTIAFCHLHILHFDINHTSTASAGWEAKQMLNNGEGEEKTNLLSCLLRLQLQCM